MRLQLKSSTLHLLRHFVALDIIPQLASGVFHNPFVDRSLVVLVTFAKFDLKNVGEVVIGQGVCFGEVSRSCITVNQYIQVVDSKELPFGNYQPSGT